VRGLAACPASAIPDLQAAVGQALDRRLRRGTVRPIAVALSGGGDSLALTLIAAAWARAAGRPLLVLTVDHRLQPASAEWTAACATTAERLGAGFRALVWEGEKPTSGLPAAARAVRHALIADAAREARASVVLMGHTADDVAEARRMRAAGSTTPDPREWGPSPAWPEGRGVFLLRPLLGLARSDLRAWLTSRGETWIDDPANDDLRFARARARRSGGPAPVRPEPVDAADLARACQDDGVGGLGVARALLRAAPTDAARRFVSAACVCAGGTARPPAGARVERLLARLAGHAAFTSGLAGARVAADASQVRFTREPGEAARGGLLPLRLAAGETGVWDGRFEVSTDAPVEVRAGRRGAPVAVGVDGEVREVRLAALVHGRLLAACGAVEREPA